MKKWPSKYARDVQHELMLCLHRYMISPIRNCKRAMPTSHDPPFQTSRTETNYDVMISKWKEDFNEHGAQWASKGAAVANDEAHVKPENRQENCHTDNEKLISREVKGTGKDLVATELSNRTEESLDNVLNSRSISQKAAYDQACMTSLSK